jgi:geranylgeranyl pyrophosphate synthase
VATSSEALERWLEESRAFAEAALERSAAAGDLGPPHLAEAARYALFGAGKRLRPAVVRLTCAECGGRDSEAAAPAAAVELVHTYSLVHDDLPAMDDDVQRRGRPTTHVAFGEDLGILVGDALQARAFEVLARHGGKRAIHMVAVLAEAAGAAGMVGGQALDLRTAAGAPPAEVERIHALKTAALFAAAAELGALAAGAGGARAAAARAWGRSLGLLFQAVDDVLDATVESAELGKTAGQDARNERPCLVASLGIDGARRAVGERLAAARAAGADAGFAPGGRAAELLAYVAGRAGRAGKAGRAAR